MAFDIETTPLISIHAPRTGSDNTKTNQSVSPAISIHAPRTGSDSTRPLSSRGFIFQSTLPARGATGTASRRCVVLCHFNPRSPHGERLRLGGQRERMACISIHAPRTGSDRGNPAFRPSYRNFNPRSPHGERRRSSQPSPFPLHYFNPRSPHGERQTSALAMGFCSIFQSTLPARGAT